MMPLFISFSCNWFGANIFIAAFLSGALFGYFSRLHHEDHSLAELLEALADVLSYVVWYLAGQFLVAAFKAGFRWQWVVVAVATLIPLRMATVYMSLVGSTLDWRSQVLNY